jgi:hypothetical protein
MGAVRRYPMHRGEKAALTARPGGARRHFRYFYLPAFTAQRAGHKYGPAADAADPGPVGRITFHIGNIRLVLR